MAYGYSSFYYTATNAALRATAFIASWLTVQFGLEGVEAWKPGFTISPLLEKRSDLRRAAAGLKRTA